MPTRNISLPKELDDYVEAKVASGQYSHYSEVLRDGVRLLMQHEAEKLAWLRAAVKEGIESEKEGLLTWDEADERLRKVVEELRAEERRKQRVPARKRRA